MRVGNASQLWHCAQARCSSVWPAGFILSRPSGEVAEPVRSVALRTDMGKAPRCVRTSSFERQMSMACSFATKNVRSDHVLIAADIIDTLMKPTTQDLIVLGAIVAIRTVISYSLNS